MLISKAIVDGVEGGAGSYSAQQRQRLYREGIREFFRLDAGDGPRIDTIGDCGAFQYVREPAPPYTVDEVIDFYEGCGRRRRDLARSRDPRLRIAPAAER